MISLNSRMHCPHRDTVSSVRNGGATTQHNWRNAVVRPPAGILNSCVVNGREQSTTNYLVLVIHLARNLITRKFSAELIIHLVP